MNEAAINIIDFCVKASFYFSGLNICSRVYLLCQIIIAYLVIHEILKMFS